MYVGYFVVLAILLYGVHSWNASTCQDLERDVESRNLEIEKLRNELDECKLGDRNNAQLPDALVAKDLVYNNSRPLAFENVSSVLNKRYTKCLLQSSKPFCLLSIDKRIELLRIESSDSSNVEIIESKLQNITSDLQDEGQLMHNLLVDFTTLMAAAGVKAILIEPSMLFCLLSPSKRYNLLMRGLNPGRLQGSRNVVTFGIFQKDSKKLQETIVTSTIVSAGFDIMKIRKWVKSWSWDKNGSTGSFETVHHFFIRQELTVHVIVFYARNSYLWHAGLDPDEIDFEGLLFVYDAVFENFTGYPLNLKGSPMKQIFIPHDLRYFFGEIEASRFTECPLQTEVSNSLASEHAFLTVEQLKRRVVIALKEIKTVLAPQNVMFWIWSSSFLGWLKQCNVLHFSSVLELSVAYKSVKGLNMTELFADNDFLKFEKNITSDLDFEYHLDCHGMRINIYIMHEDRKFWYKHSDGQNMYKLMYPEFTMCSTDIYGQKVNVPCNEDLMSLEYMKNWTDASTHSGLNISLV